MWRVLLTKTFHHSWSIFSICFSIFFILGLFFWVSLPAAVYHNFVDLLSAKSNKNNNNKKSNNRAGKIKKGANRKAGSATPKKVSSNKNFAK